MQALARFKIFALVPALFKAGNMFTNSNEVINQNMRLTDLGYNNK